MRERRNTLTCLGLAQAICAMLTAPAVASPGTLRIDEQLVAVTSVVQSIPSPNSLAAAQEAVLNEPSEANYLTLSLEYHRAKRYEESVRAAKKILARGGFSRGWIIAAHNNLCIAYIMLGEFDQGDAECRTALGLYVEYERAKNNLAHGRRLKARLTPYLDAIAADPTAWNYIELSYQYYNMGIYGKALDAAESALRVEPGNAAAYNNICAARNALGNYASGIEACEQALKLDPGHQLARNNLRHARAKVRP